MNLRRNEKFLTKALYPCVRVRTDKAGGSGQVIHSSRKNGTFILSCHHVIDDAIQIKDQWSSVLQRTVKRDIFSPVTVDFFKYSYKDRVTGSESKTAQIIVYDKDEDIALLKVEDPEPYPYVADLYPCEGEDDPKLEEDIDIGSEIVTVGAPLLHDPIPTVGNLVGFKDIIDNRRFWMATGPTIFGNSGGGTYLADTWQLVGMPARIAVSASMFSMDAITHMCFIIPITRIVRFLKDSMMDFLFDDNVSWEECKKKIEEKRKMTELEALLEQKVGR